MAYYENLNVWKKSIDIAVLMYQSIAKNSNFSRDFGLKDQFQRSVVSIASNIAEGSERESTTEFIRFLIIARGSLAEAKTQLLIARNIDYIDSDSYTHLNESLIEIHKMLNSLITSLRNKG